MKRVLQVLAVLAVLLVVLVVGVYGYLNMALGNRFAQTFETHSIDLPTPMPLTEAELQALREEKLAEMAPAEGEEPAPPLAEGEEPVDVLADVDLDALALERALERGKHLVEARFACVECHGRDFGGGKMVDDGAMGQWLGPNLTMGEGSKTRDYKMSDWDRIVRHGVKPDGTPAMMPSEDFFGMSDQELSDIVTYVRSFPPVDKTMAPVSFGPIGMVLAATGQLPLSAEHHDHQAAHEALPPETAVSVEFGKHLVQVCTGCHRPELNGGPIPIGPPDWPPARNLTPHEQGLAGWTAEEFATAMQTGKRRDGTDFLAPMNLMTPYANEMTDVELQALFMYLQSLEGKPTGT
jgi:mono/diheme cytochrome c family protein